MTITTMTEPARERRLDAHRRYNTSAKGQRRNLRYEARHPERKLRWEPARNALRSGIGPPPDMPMHDGADMPPEPPTSHTETTEGVLTR